MVLRKLPRNPALDGLDLFRRLDLGAGSQPLGEPNRVDLVVDSIRSTLVDQLNTPTVVRGWRAQALFASLVAALDGCDLMTMVDIGEIYADGDNVKAPDFFLHLRDGRRILVDVKDVDLAEPDLDLAIKFGASEVSRMRRFGDLYGADVFIALYFQGFPLWSLVPLNALVAGPGGGYRITVKQALLANQVAILGDRSIGIEPPLECVFLPDEEEPHEVDENGHAPFTIGAVEMYAGGQKIKSEAGQRIVWFLMLNGSWDQREVAETEDGKLVALRWIAEPIEPTGQGFEIVGALSSLYSRQFEDATSQDGEFVALDLEIRPGTLVALIPHDYDSDDPPLLRLELKPATHWRQPWSTESQSSRRAHP